MPDEDEVFMPKLSLRSWQLPTMVIVTILALVPFIPPFDHMLSDGPLSYILFIIAIIIDTAACLSLVFPLKFEQSGLLDMDDWSSRRPRKEDLDDPLVQLKMYRELRQAFVSRIKRRRRLSGDEWNRIQADAVALSETVRDIELRRFLCVGLTEQSLQLTGPSVVVFGDGFRDRFESLLRKVEGWS